MIALLTVRLTSDNAKDVRLAAVTATDRWPRRLIALPKARLTSDNAKDVRLAAVTAIGQVAEKIDCVAEGPAHQRQRQGFPPGRSNCHQTGGREE